MNEIDTIIDSFSFKRRNCSPEGLRLLPADETTISQFETDIDLKFPPDYRYFLEGYEGIWLNNVMVRPAIQNERLEWELNGPFLLEFYGFYETSPQGRLAITDLRWKQQALKDHLPTELVPIAGFFDTHNICISCSEGTFGRVFIKLSEEFDDDDPADFLFPHASNFLDFLRSLRTLTDEEADEFYKRR